MAQDALQQLENQLKNYIELGRRVLRRWWLIGIFTVLGAGISVGMAFNMTRIYQSRTLVAWQEVQDREAFTGQESRRQENWLRIRLEETLSSNTFLLKMMRQMDLFPAMREAVAPEEVLVHCRDRIKFGMVGSDSFWIAFEYKDPKKAQQVATYLARAFINKNVRDSVAAAQSTLNFMVVEVKKAKKELIEIEGRMAQFVADHPEYRTLPAGGTPTAPAPAAPSANAYVSVSQTPELRQALAQKGRLQAQLRVLMNPQTDSRLIRARQEVDRARRRIASLRRKYTGRHPDVQAAEQILRQAQTQLGLTQNASKSDTGTITRLQSEIAALDSSIAKLSRRRKRSSPQPAVVRPAAPKRPLLSKKARLEKDWYSLTRDKEVATSKNDQLQTRLTRAKMTASLERKQAETQFTIVDRANLPQKPTRPNRTKLAMAGTTLGFMVGLAIAVLLMIFDSRIYSQQDLRKVCDLPVLAQVPKES